MKAYYNARLFDGEKWHKDACILTLNNRIVEIVDKKTLPSGINSINLNQKIVAPAFVDLQIYGGNGHLFGEYPSVLALKNTYDYCLAGGASRFLPTVATHSKSVMLAAIDAVKAYWEAGEEGVLGLHLEGPHINQAKRGAHLTQYIREFPSVAYVKSLLDYGEGVIKMMTLAPEVVGDKIIDLLQAKGVVVSIGHSNATFNEAKAAMKIGVNVATHLFNAMSPFQHRELGLVGAIYADKNICTSIVADGYHVDFEAIKISKTILQERLFLITDAVTQNPNGLYNHRLNGDKYVVADGTLSGSALTMLKAVQNCVEKVGIPLEESLKMASLYPAKVLGLDQTFGRFGKGFNNDFIIFDNNFKLSSLN